MHITTVALQLGFNNLKTKLKTKGEQMKEQQMPTGSSCRVICDERDIGNLPIMPRQKNTNLLLI